MQGFRLIPAMVTLLLHGLVAAVLLIGLPGISDSQELKPKPVVIQAKLVIDKVPPSRAKPAPPAKPKPAPKPKPVVKPKPEVKPKPAPEPKPKPKPAPKPKGPTAEEIRQKKAADKAAEEARQRALQEQIRKQQQEELAAALASEDAALEEAELVSSYEQLIAQLVTNNWSRPPSARNGMSVTVAIRTLPTGEIISASVVKGSGNEAFDQSALRAVKGLGEIAELGELAQQNRAAYERKFRHFQFKFEPTDLRR